MGNPFSKSKVKSDEKKNKRNSLSPLIESKKEDSSATASISEEKIEDNSELLLPHISLKEEDSSSTASISEGEIEDNEDNKLLSEYIDTIKNGNSSPSVIMDLIKDNKLSVFPIFIELLELYKNNKITKYKISKFLSKCEHYFSGHPSIGKGDAKKQMKLFAVARADYIQFLEPKQDSELEKLGKVSRSVFFKDKLMKRKLLKQLKTVLQFQFSAYLNPFLKKEHRSPFPFSMSNWPNMIKKEPLSQFKKKYPKIFEKKTDNNKYPKDQEMLKQVQIISKAEDDSVSSLSSASP